MNKKIQKIIPLSLGVLVFSLFAAYLLHAWTEPTLPPPQGQVEIRATAMATTTGSPIPADCDEAAERGRVRIDPATDRQYLCGNLGWTFLAAAPAHHTLTVTTTGSGTVTSTDMGINCPGDCSEIYEEGSSVTLTASPDPGWSFSHWAGDCTGSGACVVSMTTARSVTATFSQIFHTLTVTTTGSGTVTSTDMGINCPGDCTEVYAHGISVTLTATPASGWEFDSWGGACTGTGACIVSMDADRTVQATFAVIPSPYFLFDTAETSNGNLGGRAGADAMCAADADRPTVCTTRAWAFISVSTSDEIRDMTAGGEGLGWVTETAAPWYFSDGGATKRRAASTWSQLLDGEADNTPASGGFDGSLFWTGSHHNGQRAFTCSQWTNAEHTRSGTPGRISHATNWLSRTSLTCIGATRLICACI